jgi:hypothetical protein
MITQNYAAIPTKTLTTESVQSQYWSESAFYKTQARFVKRGVSPRFTNRVLDRAGADPGFFVR